MQNKKILAKVIVGSQLHGTATPASDWDYRGIHISPLTEIVSPFRKIANTTWLEGDEDNTSYELREFCKLATKGNATIWEVFFSNKIVQTSPEHREMQINWLKFFDTFSFIQASRGYASNQYKKALSYEDLGEKSQPRTAKFIISFIRVMWQCEQTLLTGEFPCSLEECEDFEFIKAIKPLKREQLDIPLCFSKLETYNQRLYRAEEYCKTHSPRFYNCKPDIAYIEDFLLRAYIKNSPNSHVEAPTSNGSSEDGKSYVSDTKALHRASERRLKAFAPYTVHSAIDYLVPRENRIGRYGYND